jgi:hypothetical protein
MSLSKARPSFFLDVPGKAKGGMQNAAFCFFVEL